MAFFLGLDSLQGSRFTARTLFRDQVRHHSILSDGLVIALLWVSLLMSSDLVPGKSSGLRRIQNYHPYRFSHWSPSKDGPLYDYLVQAQPDEDSEEDDSESTGPPPPPALPALNHYPPPIPQRPSPHNPYIRRRPPGVSLRPTEYYQRPSVSPQPVSFNGNFHITSDRFVPFEPNDARTQQPPPGIEQTFPPTQGGFRPPDTTLTFVRTGDRFTSSGRVQHMGVAQAGLSGERIRFNTPEDDTTTPLDDRSLYYSPPTPTTTAEPFYVPSDPPDDASQGDDPRVGDSPTYLSQPDSDPLQYKRWHKDPVTTYLKTPPTGNTPIRTSSGLTEIYYPSEFTSQTPYWTEHVEDDTTPEHEGDSRRPPYIPSVNSEDFKDATDPGRYANWPTDPSVLNRPSTEGRDYKTNSGSGTTIVTNAGKDVASSEQPISSKDRETRTLSTGAIAGIAIGILAPLALVAGAMAYLVYGRHFKHVTHNGDGRSIAERGSYIDDSVRPSGYMNSHIELPKESSEEMTSLDNDSFLNSLEAVTIQNYWAESAKNTKV